MLKILVSSCLLGETVRYDGKNKLIENDILRLWVDQDRVISFCPEVSAGLPVPRTAAEIAGVMVLMCLTEQPVLRIKTEFVSLKNL